MPGTLCSQILAGLAPSCPSSLRLNATSAQRPFLVPFPSWVSYHTTLSPSHTPTPTQLAEAVMIGFAPLPFSCPIRRKAQKEKSAVFLTAVTLYLTCIYAWSACDHSMVSWDRPTDKDVHDQGFTERRPQEARGRGGIGQDW